MLFLLNALIGAGICLLTWALWSRRKFYLFALKVPGPFGFPLIGSAHKLLKREDILLAFGELKKKYGSKMSMWLGPIPTYVTSDPQACRDILTSSNCVNKAVVYNIIDETIGSGLFSIKNPGWSTHRKLLNPAFSYGILLSFIRIFNERTDELITIFDGVNAEDEINVMPVLMDFTIGLAVETTMDLKLSIAEKSESKVLLLFQRILEFGTEAIFMPWLPYKLKLCRMLGMKIVEYEDMDKIRNFAMNIVNNQMISNGATNTNRNIFVHCALENLKNGQFTLNEIASESTTIVIAAFETTAKVIAFTLIMLAMHPEYQERAFEEINSVIADSDTSEVTNDLIQKMTYLEMVINETMRIMTPVPIVGRQATDEVKLSDGTILPEGMQIVIDIFHMHRDENVWGKGAHLFNPDHFLPASVEQRHPYAYIPFTKGIRSCIGNKYSYMALKVILSKLIRNYHFDTKFKYEDLQFVENITLKLGKMPLLMISKRHQVS